MQDSWLRNISSWEELDFWRSDEWKRVQEKLDVLDDQGIGYCPHREDLFSALDACPYEQVTCTILGQDPYPNPVHATGIAFSIPKETPSWYYPSTLKNIFKELKSDLHLPNFEGCFQGDLSPWCTQGLLMLNRSLTCLSHRPGSHSSWMEWPTLISEILFRVSSRHKVFVFLGSKAKELSNAVQTQSTVLCYSHPSPLGAFAGASRFMGSRIFSRINQALVEQGEWPIDWNLNRGNHEKTIVTIGKEVSGTTVEASQARLYSGTVLQTDVEKTFYGEGLSIETGEEVVAEAASTIHPGDLLNGEWRPRSRGKS